MEEKNNKALTGCLYILVAILLVVVVIVAIDFQNKQEALKRCTHLQYEQVEFIDYVIKYDYPNHYVKDGYLVKSKDYENTYFIAVFVYGPGDMNGAGPLVFWTPNGPNEAGAPLLSANKVAEKFSGVQLMTNTHLGVSSLADGIKQAEICAKYYK